ncbi:MAG: hypothetical protein ACYDC7_01350 [Acidithiobacillus ferrivorans]|uniref:hypothetical protein n=1 Tax=Acidithiobacillus ferrivorans TaxID=160808 RepID=UPI0003072E71|nr:hypothetical protein [Acidithiobacillus ferrivorans]OFA16485.1 hypothetical protein A4U49_07115 [Acidithiobacillus ferrivorans]
MSSDINFCIEEGPENPQGGSGSCWTAVPGFIEGNEIKIDLFSLDMLVNMATAAGLHIELRVLDAA